MKKAFGQESEPIPRILDSVSIKNGTVCRIFVELVSLYAAICKLSAFRVLIISLLWIFIYMELVFNPFSFILKVLPCHKAYE